MVIACLNQTGELLIPLSLAYPDYSLPPPVKHSRVVLRRRYVQVETRADTLQCITCQYLEPGIPTNALPSKVDVDSYL